LANNSNSCKNLSWMKQMGWSWCEGFWMKMETHDLLLSWGYLEIVSNWLITLHVIHIISKSFHYYTNNLESLIPKDKMHHNFFIVKLISRHVGNKLRIERTRGNSFLGKKDEEQSSTILWWDCASKDVPSPI
jgi:hypothetical protein